MSDSFDRWSVACKFKKVISVVLLSDSELYDICAKQRLRSTTLTSQ